MKVSLHVRDNLRLIKRKELNATSLDISLTGLGDAAMNIDWSKYIRKKEEFEYDENCNIEDFRRNPLITTRSIKEFFDGSNVFVTGSTGFLGKVLIEKLLRSCDGINKIYIILRPKRGLRSEQRFEEFKANKIFERIREKTPDVMSKLVFVAGDINEPNIGLDEKDSKILQETVHIVFHVAATVRFNEPLQDAANLNTFGTQRVMELSTKMKHLKVNFMDALEVQVSSVGDCVRFT